MIFFIKHLSSERGIIYSAAKAKPACDYDMLTLTDALWNVDVG